MTGFFKKLFRRKAPTVCLHLNGRETRSWENGTAYSSFRCPDCGVYDYGHVLTLDTKEDWLGLAPTRAPRLEVVR